MSGALQSILIAVLVLAVCIIIPYTLARLLRSKDAAKNNSGWAYFSALPLSDYELFTLNETGPITQSVQLITNENNEVLLSFTSNLKGRRLYVTEKSGSQFELVLQSHISTFSIWLHRGGAETLLCKNARKDPVSLPGGNYTIQTSLSGKKTIYLGSRIAAMSGRPGLFSRKVYIAIHKETAPEDKSLLCLLATLSAG